MAMTMPVLHGGEGGAGAAGGVMDGRPVSLAWPLGLYHMEQTRPGTKNKL